MTEYFSYEKFVKNKNYLDKYNTYQSKYIDKIRESDRVILDLIDEFFSNFRSNGNVPHLLDIGCSTGNLLLHIKRAFGDRLKLIGGDLALSSLNICRGNPDFSGISFEELDITNLPKENFDVIVVNAVLYMFNTQQYEASLSSLHDALRPGGVVLIYDFANPFSQDLEIIEKSCIYPDGMRLCFRAQEYIIKAVSLAGFTDLEFRPFELPIDLPKPEGNHDITTYTVKDQRGHRMMFRGMLYQPWCHIIARKPSNV